MNRNQDQIKVYRTTEGTIFEVATVILAIVVWGLIIWFVNQAPDIIPTHFDASGKPNAWGPPAGILIPCAVVSISGIVLMILCYFPKAFNLSEKHKTPRNYAISIRMMRIMGILMQLLTLAIAWISLRSTSHSMVPVLVIVGLMVLTAIISTIAIYTNKSKS